MIYITAFRNERPILNFIKRKSDMKRKTALIIPMLCMALMSGCININIPVKEEAKVSEDAAVPAGDDVKVEEKEDVEPAIEEPAVHKDEEYYIDKLINEKGISKEDIITCRVGEFEGKDLFSAFIFEGSLADDEIGVYDGQLWFVNEDTIELVHDENSYYSIDNVLSFEGTDKSFFYVEDYYVTASVARIYGVKDGKPYEPVISGVGGLIKGEGNDFSLVISSYDHTMESDMDYPLGHTWKPYYFYYDSDTDSFKEYVGTLINEETLKEIVDRDIIADIKAADGYVYEIYSRENGIITVNYQFMENYEDGRYTETFENANYDCNRKCYIDVWETGDDSLENSSYGGTYSAVLLPMLMYDENKSDDELYDLFIEGKIRDANGDFNVYAGANSEEFSGIEYARYDIDGDGTKELIPLLYSGYTACVYTIYDGAIHTIDMYDGIFGSEGGFFNTNNQYVGTDVIHADRESYIVSEVNPREGLKQIICFGKWNNDDGTYTYQKYEGEDIWDASEDEYVEITKEEFEKLVNKYTKVNEEIEFREYK